MRFLHVSSLVSSALLATVLSAQGPLTIVNTTFPPGAVGQGYAQALTATGGTQPYTWSATGKLPPGLPVRSVGTISGTPLTGGTYSFTVKVVDANNASTSKTLSIVISGPGAATLTVSTTTLPSGTVGLSYSQILPATGGTPPYQWAVGTSFPAFFTLDSPSGTVSGTPTSAGTFSFLVKVTDSARASSTATVALTINNPPLTITTLAPIFSGTVGVPLMVRLGGSKLSPGTDPATRDQV